MIDLNPALIEQLGLSLLHFLWQGTLIGLLYWLTLIIARPASAQTRYTLAVGTLFALGLAPIVTFFQLGAVSTGAPAPLNADAAAIAPMLVTASSPAGPPSLLAWTVVAWLAGVALLSLRLLLGWRHIVRLRRSAQRQALSHLTPLLEHLRKGMAIGKPVILAASDRVRSPVVVGWLKPLILFPTALVNRLDADQIEMILAHELAHIRRHDHLVNLIQTVIETLLFYHPVVALVSRRIRIERENACDDLAVRSTGKRLAYVEMLATLERLRQPGPRLALGVQDGQILGRIRRLVERSRPRRQMGITLPALLGLMLAAGGIGVQMMPAAEPDSPAREAIQESIQEPVVRNAIEARADESDNPPRPDLASTETLNDESTPADEAPDTVAPEPALDQSITPAPSVEAPAANRIAEAGRPSVDNDTLAESEPEPSMTLARAEPAPDDAQPPATEPSETTPADAPALTLATRPETPIVDTAPEPAVSIEPVVLTGGELVQRIDPEFPSQARRRGVSGKVELEFTVDQRGQVQAIEVIQEQPVGWRFGESAREAIAQWRFEPYRLGDQTVEQARRVEVDFDLAEACEIRTGSRLPRC
jgi:bla regulator protein BlaR1